MTEINTFSSQDLQAACRILADTEHGLTGSQIGIILREIELPDPDPSLTKWKRLYNALANAQNEHKLGNHLIQFINHAMNPVRFTSAPENFSWLQENLNAVLVLSGFYVRNDGKVGYCKKANTLNEALARANRLHEILKSRHVHTEVLKYCRAELLQKNYFHAVFEATKGGAERIRLLSGMNEDGATLIDKTFSGQHPLLSLNSLTTESERSEQKGFSNLLKGLFGAIRNPQAHATKKDWPMPEQDALDILALISLIHRKLDSVKKHIHPQGTNTSRG